MRNALRYPGAVFADLAMQIFGLGVIAILLPVAVWGWRLMRARRLERLQLRLALWIIGSGAATAVASALPPTARWPLPTGLGGVVGDALLGALRAVTGLASAPSSAVIGFVCAGVAILSLTAACAFGADEANGARPAEDEVEEAEEDEEEDEADDAPRDEEPGWGMVLLGGIAHAFMSVKAALQRRREARHAARDEDLAPVRARAQPRPARAPGALVRGADGGDGSRAR